MAVYVSGRLSGGHINPAVTLALVSRGAFPGGRLLPYWGAQLAGAFVGALLVYADYGDAFGALERDEHVVRGLMEAGKLVGPSAGGAGIFATYPAFDTTWRNVFSEFLGTAVLLLGVRALTDRRNAAPGGFVEPLALGGLVWAIGLSLGGLTGYAINPAHELRSATGLGPPRLGTGRIPVARLLLLDPDRRAASRRPRGYRPVRLRDSSAPAAGRPAQPAG